MHIYFTGTFLSFTSFTFPFYLLMLSYHLPLISPPVGSPYPFLAPSISLSLL